MIKKDTRAFAKGIISFLKDKPKGKWQAVAHVWDRLIMAGAGLIVTVTAFVTNQGGLLILILWSLGLLIFGVYLTSKGR